MEKKPLVILTGPTGVGKTKISIELAKKIEGEIISADSMQVYRFMDIGTAKIKQEQMQKVKHYLIDEQDPDEEFNVVVFQEKAKKAIEEITQKGKTPILVGGTGFYIQAVLYDIHFEKQDKEKEIRKELEKIAKEKGASFLHAQLEKVDPVSALSIPANNIKRVIRALEFYEKTKEKISSHNEREKQRQSPYQFSYFVLTQQREQLYENIDKRVDLMMEQGLLEEVKNLCNKGYKKELPSMQGLGYRQLIDYLEGIMPLEEAIRILKRDTRHFAKRQLTWFRREREVIWIEKEKFENDDTKIVRFLLKELEEKGILKDVGATYRTISEI